MKVLKFLRLSVIAVTILSSFAFAAMDVKISEARKGDVKKEKALFNDPKFGGGTTGKSCNSCHPDGKGLERFVEQKEFDSTGKISKSPEERVDMCIKKSMKGVGMDLKGADMANVIAYIKSLKKPAEEHKKIPEKAPMKAK